MNHGDIPSVAQVQATGRAAVKRCGERAVHAAMAPFMETPVTGMSGPQRAQAMKVLQDMIRGAIHKQEEGR